MEHIKEIELTEYVGGNLAAERAQQVREHTAACPECSQRVLEAERLWNTLGDWSVETAGHDVADRVVALAHRPSSLAHRPSSIVPRLSFVLRVAASIIIAVGVGHKLGEYSVTSGKPQAASSEDEPDYLAALGLEWSSGLAWLVLEEAPAEMGGER